jgi:hypothetical protein
MSAMLRKPSLAVLAAIFAAAAPAAFAQSSKVQTTSEANRQSLKGAAQAPLRDLNVVRTQVPQVLVEALADPYARPKTKKCPELVASILALNDALGPDIDAPAETEQSLAAKGRPMALGAAAGFASDLIPFRGVVRQATGAAKHDEYVQQSILAGSTRRAYLKGLGEARGCKPPATPSHVLAGSPLPAEVNAGIGRGLKPRYPVKR